MVLQKFFFNIARCPITESLVKPLSIVITVDVLEQSEPNLLNIFERSVLGEPLLFQFYQETFAWSV